MFTTLTTSPCYSADVMYRENVVLSIKQVETNRDIPIPSLRTDAAGVTFSDMNQPTLLVTLNSSLVSQIISISIPNVNGATNVNQIELTFYGTDGQILLNPLGAQWVVETTPGVTTVCVMVQLI